MKFSLSRFFAVFTARNNEFFRDKSALGWNLAFPILLIIGFYFVFSGEGKKELKWGVLGQPADKSLLQSIRFVDLVDYQSKDQAIEKIARHQIDLLLDFDDNNYYVNSSSGKGYLSEGLLEKHALTLERKAIMGRAVRYVDWVIPGIIGMNLMFSCLFGVGYVIVRYRKSGVLKRLRATPVSALEFIMAQVASRCLIVVFVTMMVFLSIWWVIDIRFDGSLFAFFLVLFLGTIAMIAMGLMIASRSRSEELTGGLLNLASWPMMFLSGVWFSLEGAPDTVKLLAQFLPLTHFVDAARAILIDGATLLDVSFNLTVLTMMAMIFMLVGSWSFSWGTERQ